MLVNMFRMVALPVAVLVLATNQIAAGQNFKCTIGNGTLPSHCLEAVNNYLHVSKQIATSNTTKLLSYQTADVLQTETKVICSGKCLDPILKCQPNSSHNSFLNLMCVRSEDGYFCLVEQLREQARVGKFSILPANCFNNPTCSAFCQQSLHDLKNRLGCCTSNMYAGIPTTAKYFATCNVSLDMPCKPASVTSGTTEITEMTNMTDITETSDNSGASFLSLNLVLVAALFLVVAITVV